MGRCDQALLSERKAWSSTHVIEKMLRMYLLQIWFNLSDPATEDAIYDSYAMRKFTGINFMTETVPDETTLCKFRHLLEANGLNKLFFDAINRVMVVCPFSENGAEKQINNSYFALKSP